MKKIARSLYDLIFFYDWVVVELIASLMAMTWGAWFLYAVSSFSTSAVFSVLESFITQTQLGTIMVSVGLAQFVAVYARVYWLRKYMTLTAMFLWCAMGVMFALGSTASVGIPTMAILTFFLVINYIRITPSLYY